MASLPCIKELQRQAKQGPVLSECESLVESLESELQQGRPSPLISPSMLKVLSSFQKSARAVKRHATMADQLRWNDVLGKVERIASHANDAPANIESSSATTDDHPSTTSATGLPKTMSEYLSRLNRQNKELYKNPPVMPPGSIMVFATKCALPSRDKRGRLVFVAGENSAIELQLKDFRPNVTPEEVLRAGAFGGTYFRSITSAVTGMSYTSKSVLDDTVAPEWIDGLDHKHMLTSQIYNAIVNKYAVKCGGSLGMWESSGWISDVDPYGWFQWFCRFYQGRRCSDDARQISRWLKCAGPKGRFKSQLCNKILAANTRSDDASISPVIRQTLWHWGLLVNDDVVESHRKSR